jgi:hypothetical protein
MMKPGKRQIRKEFRYCCGLILHINLPALFIPSGSEIPGLSELGPGTYENKFGEQAVTIGDNL